MKVPAPEPLHARDPQGSTTVRLSDIPLGQEVELDSMELPEAEMETLLERGVLPGCRMCPVRHSPFGDPVVHVDGTVLALRRELASCLCVRILDGTVLKPWS